MPLYLGEVYSEMMMQAKEDMAACGTPKTPSVMKRWIGVVLNKKAVKLRMVKKDMKMHVFFRPIR